jgi:hypothetical protein
MRWSYPAKWPERGDLQGGADDLLSRLHDRGFAEIGGILALAVLLYLTPYGCLVVLMKQLLRGFGFKTTGRLKCSGPLPFADG